MVGSNVINSDSIHQIALPASIQHPAYHADPDAHAAVVAPFLMRVVLLFAVGMILFLGIFPGAAMEFARTSVDSLTNLSGFLVGLAP